jgi:hypothetical protein
MPDFDTRTRQEPDQPNRHANMTLRLGIGGSILLLAVVAVVITVRAVDPIADHLAGPPADQLDQAKAQLDQEIQLKPPPAYSLHNDMESSAYYCEPEDAGYGPSVCFGIITKTSDAMKLASITEDITTHSDYEGSRVGRLKVVHGSLSPETFATIYCFDRKRGKSVAVSALGSALKRAKFLGKTDNCYLTIYKGDVELLLIPPA